MITIKTTKDNKVGVRISKKTNINEIYTGTGILLSILMENNGKTVDETLDMIKKIIERNKVKENGND